MSDPYTILGVSKNASPDEIKKAYRKLAHQHHPDKRGGDEKKFKEINEAYQILSDSEKKSRYDQFGHAGANGFGGNGQGFGGFDFGGGFEDIFNMFSGGQGFGGRRNEPSKGEDLHIELHINKKDFGQIRRFEFDTQKACQECSGSGVAKGHSLKTCGTCRGAGQVQQNVRTLFGTFSAASVCGECGGKGKIPEKICSECKGHGRVKSKRPMEVHVPEKVEDGYTIVVPKGGNAGPEGKPAGDLIIQLRVR
jgi:molecular chaperone DnaJ